MDQRFAKQNNPQITTYLKRISTKRRLCFILTPYILSMNYFQHKNHIEFLENCIKNGSKFVKELTLNVVYFLLLDEEFGKVHQFFLQPMTDLYNRSPSSKVKKLVTLTRSSRT